MTFIPPWEKIIETKTCRISGEKFVVTDKDLEFYEKVSPVFGGKKYSIPSPTLCPEERYRRRMTFRNENKIYSRVCDVSWKNIVSSFHANKIFPVYDHTLWKSDSWNALDYGVSIDFDTPFFDQFAALRDKVPHPSLLSNELENSQYNANSGWLKDCYLLSNSNTSERCMYGKAINDSFDILDGYIVEQSEKCYEVINIHKCYGLKYSQNCYDCRDSLFLSDCRNCQECIGCINLRNKKFCIQNKQLQENEYFIRKQELIGVLEKWSFCHDLFWDKFIEFPREHLHLLQCENVYSDYATNCKDTYQCFDVRNCQDLRYCSDVFDTKDSMDVCYFGMGLQYGYESTSIGGDSSNILFCVDSWLQSSDLLYCMYCLYGSKNCFWCVWLHNWEQNCILNTSYSKKEYEELASKFSQHMKSTNEWWEFFPMSLSPFCYTESAANDFLPLNITDIKKLSWNIDHIPQVKYEWSAISPLSITQYDETVVGWEVAKNNINHLLSNFLVCDTSEKPFKIVSKELAFYIENKIPIPTKHPDQRYNERLALRNPRKLWKRTCDKCGVDIQTTYAPDKSEGIRQTHPKKVYCEKCYRKTVY